MVTAYECALFSAQLSKHKYRLPVGWRKLESIDQRNTSGLLATAYQQGQTIVIAVATPLTKANAQDKMEEIIVHYQMIEKHYPKVRQFIQNCLRKHDPQQHCCVVFTGHGNGAVYAEISAVEFKRRAVTFDSLGSKNLIKKLNPKANVILNDITSYLSAPNALNTLDEQIGRMRYRIYIKHVDGLSSEHIAKCLWGSASRGLMYYSFGLLAGVGSAVTSSAPAIAEPAKHTANLAKEIAPRLVSNSQKLAVTAAKKTTQIATNAAINTTINASNILNRTAVSTLICNRLAMQVVSDATWTMRQHSIDNILQTFDTDKHLPRLYRAIASWPTLQEKSLFSVDTLKEIAYDSIPFRTANRGLHTLWRENEVIEAQIVAIPGYQVLSADNPELTDNHIHIQPKQSHKRKGDDEEKTPSLPSAKSRPRSSLFKSTNKPAQSSIAHRNKRARHVELFDSQINPTPNEIVQPHSRKLEEDEAFLARFA